MGSFRSEADRLAGVNMPSTRLVSGLPSQASLVSAAASVLDPSWLKRLASPAVLAVYAVLLGLGLGLGTAYWAISGDYPLGRVRVGPWTLWPRIGSRDIDPYARAIMARTGAIPLGVGEGLMLVATVDDADRALEARCAYRIGSATPPARLWTITSYGPPGSGEPPRGLTSAQLVRDANGDFGIVAAVDPRPGNWLALPQSGAISFVLRLYDTPVAASSTALDRRALPGIDRLECLP